MGSPTLQTLQDLIFVDGTQMAVELKYAAKELVLNRRAKLKTLLDGEKLNFESELNAMGLAVAKARY
jgi:hypothetical protein